MTGGTACGHRADLCAADRRRTDDLSGPAGRRRGGERRLAARGLSARRAADARLPGDRRRCSGRSAPSCSSTSSSAIRRGTTPATTSRRGRATRSMRREHARRRRTRISRAFVARRGKLLLWHGWSDAALNARRDHRVLRAGGGARSRRSGTPRASSCCPACNTAPAAPGPTRWTGSPPSPTGWSAGRRPIGSSRRSVEKRRHDADAPALRVSAARGVRGTGSTDEAQNFVCRSRVTRQGAHGMIAIDRARDAARPAAEDRARCSRCRRRRSTRSSAAGIRPTARRCSPSTGATARAAGPSGRRASSSDRRCCSSTPPASRRSSSSRAIAR